MTSWVNGDLVVEVLRELADEDQRRRLWLSDGSDGEVGSLSECRSGLFNDSGLGAALDRGEVAFFPAADSQLSQLRQMLASIDDRQPPSEVLADPVLIEVAASARSVPDLLLADEPVT